mmetsp:Transcript_11084/g.26037  ORF Transcript_11084/g.26037 Transcript_11084/m.26037 type:complete len:255 (-) Transcript_11084:10-774(-)
MRGPHPSGLHELLRVAEPPDVLALLLVRCHGIHEVADLAAHAKLRKVFVKGLLQLVVQILELRPVVGTDAVLLLLRLVGLHHADHVAVVLPLLGAAEERQASTTLVFNGDGEFRGLALRLSCILGLIPLRVEWVSELPLHPHGLVPQLTFQGHVDIAVCLHQLEWRILEEGLELLGLLVLRLLVLQLRGEGLGDLAHSASADASHGRGCHQWPGCPSVEAHSWTPQPLQCSTAEGCPDRSRHGCCPWERTDGWC